MHKISANTQKNIVHLLQNEATIRETARSTQASIGTVAKIRKNNLNSVKILKRGRKKALSTCQKRYLVRKITSGQIDTASEAQRDLARNQGVSVSAQTVRNALKQQGLKAVVKRKKPLLTARHKKQRLEFARKYQHWTIDDWKRVVWSDETKINRMGSDERKWCWKTPGSSLQEREINPTVKHGGGNIMIWGCMTQHGVGFMCRIDGGMDDELYKNILEDYVFASVDYYGIDRGDFIFQQDNDPKHTSKIAKKWFEDNNVELLDCPSQSPDLNPIEHLWFILKKKLSEYEEAPTSIHQLWERVEREWEAISKDECMLLIESIPRRVSAMLAAKSGHTKY